MTGGTVITVTACDSRKGSCLFFVLPPELRNFIYELVLLPEVIPTAPEVWFAGPMYTELEDYDTLQVCRQMRQESLPIYYGGLPLRLRMNLDVRGVFEQWLPGQSDDGISHIRCVMLDEFQRYHSMYQVGHYFHCGAQIEINLDNLAQPVRLNHILDWVCPDCRRNKAPVEDVVRTLEEYRGRRILTKTKLIEICEAAAWPAWEKT
ncbi:hypothetical protein LTR56_019891 [Elasticomyces elasticus]|nr:hypothetical protein LTR56_019891 [Elasticomyces elasticus]KAK3642344.1 hypothetical protein LTR22_016159 [Elasticomyces elasticus]KAK4914419.1 hypothetical protein LTR49_017339 [Elasticomyces elasticus]KAK5760395.1 hypothetical protein LTS12_009439 [Elasticomyces elasticus]